MERIDPALLKRYASGQCTSEERAEIEQWLAREDNLFDESTCTPSEGAQRRELPGDTWDGFVSRLQNRLIRRRWKYTLGGLAVFAVCIWVVWYHYLPTAAGPESQKVFYRPEPGTVMRLTLPDSSRVWLAGGSVFSHPRTFGKTARTATLVSGEAYFDITRDPHRPFTVNTGHARIAVLGTRFNLQRLDRTGTVRVALESGRVALSTNQAPARQLHPGQEAVYMEQQDRLTVHDQADIDQITGWRSRLFRFKNASLDKVLEQLSRHYGVDLSIGSEVDPAIPVTGTFDNLSLPQILLLLKHSTDLKFELKDKTLTVGAAHRGASP